MSEFPPSGIPHSEPTPAPAQPVGWPASGGLPPAQLRPSGWQRWKRPVTLGGVILFFAIFAIGMLIFLGYNYGIEALLVGLAAAILPVPVLVACFLWLDRYEPEPTWALVVCFAWGAVVATAIALAVNTFSSLLFERNGISDGVVAVVVAPFIEELSKAAAPLLLLWLRRREISGITDGIVYCGLSATGFAMTENILYLGGHAYAAGSEEYGVNTGLQMLFATFLVRVLFSAFAHPLFTSMTGVGIGVAARTASPLVRWLAPIAGLLVAMMLHGTWNLIPTIAAATGQTILVLYGYFALEMPIFLAMVAFALWLRSHEGRITVRALPAYVQAGWLSPPEVAALASLGRRHAARTWAKRVAGDPGRKAMSVFQFAATRLALVRDGIERGLDRTPEQQYKAREEERALLDQISTARQVYVGRDPQTPPARWTGTAYELTFPDGQTRTVPAPPEPVVPIPVLMPPPPPAWGPWRR
ncbi:MAG: PrsW family intramembrane metalloprotease [Hamadaea sp.]|uniref:PrsW family intramembrane metalloprotease n=1 Tax=Hamadaea sp. TaxID=2024425 RepID=UPI0017FF780A|nr:PrsW family intramembrane metalloprotease [Hamadaea sp.]NUR73634.1 PrsW family intramembrane metalloprotease [Hamadaea sp.]NUT20349.1 PrsW family intramembrane metalloprotease [Hamadaea sp.]